MADREYIYPYWSSLIPNLWSAAAIPWDDMKHLCSINVSPEIAKELYNAEISGVPSLASLAGRYYEALFQANPHISNTVGSLLEGAPVDGQVSTAPDNIFGGKRDIPWQLNAEADVNVFWEMKKKRLSTNKCHFNSQNVSAIMAFNGICIGATINIDTQQVDYRWCRLVRVG